MGVYDKNRTGGLRFKEDKDGLFLNQDEKLAALPWTSIIDRIKDERIHFASAMTLLGYVDGTDYQAGVSYLELPEFLVINGANVNNDLRELWKRIVFSISVSNTDDHLRNTVLF